MIKKLNANNLNRLLIVDDDKAQLKTLSDIFSDEGFNVDGCQNAKDALKELKNNNTGIAIIDLNMPEMNGIQLLKESILHDINTRFIIHTGYGSFLTAKEAVNLGVSAYVEKLENPEELIRHVLRVYHEESKRYTKKLEETVKARTMELRSANEMLESKVEERTKKLSVLNQQLKNEIKERQEIQRALIYSERMAAVGTLVKGIAHEYNNINSMIMGFSELGLIKEKHDSKLHNYFERIHTAAIRIKNITRSLLSLSDDRKSKLKQENIVKIIEDSIILMKENYEKKGITIEMNLKNVPDVYVDEVQLGQVILHILINAEHAMLSSKKKVLMISTSYKNNFVNIMMSDTGCGIDEKDLLKVFSPFYTTKGEHSETDSPLSRVTGTGLGLSVSQTIIKNHGGEIMVNSIINEGTTVTLKLPVIKK